MDGPSLEDLQQSIMKMQGCIDAGSKLHLKRRQIRLTSKTSLAKLALHFATPVDSFFRSLYRSDKEDYDHFENALLSAWK